MTMLLFAIHPFEFSDSEDSCLHPCRDWELFVSLQLKQVHWTWSLLPLVHPIGIALRFALELFRMRKIPISLPG